MKITAEDILTSDNQHPDRLLGATSDIIHNAEVLAIDLSELLDHYGKRPKINSGLRTPEANAAAGGAKNSSHLYGLACDFADPDGSFAKWCLKNVGVIASLGLYMENPAKTRGWIHLTNRAPKSKRIVFEP